MGEFVATINRRAADRLRHIYHHEATPTEQPILELIGFLLEDGAGGVLSPEETPVTTEQWLTWQQLTLERPDEVIETITRLLEEEQIELPADLNAMQGWAAWLLLATLDQMA